IPLLWRAQEQEGWLTRPAIEHIAEMLGMAYIRVLEVATFYFMFQLSPVGSVAHVQVCGTLSCMICGAEDLIAVCKDKIADKPFALSADGKFSWEEVECLGSCSNAPMVQIGKDYYEDLTAESFADILDRLAKGDVPVPGPQNGRYGSEPLSGLTSLKEFESGRKQYNASAQLAVDIGDTVKRIQGDEVPLLAPWNAQNGAAAVAEKPAAKPAAKKAPAKPAAKPAAKKAEPKAEKPVPAAKAEPATAEGTRPEALGAARDGKADDLKMIKGVGPKLELLLNELGFYHFDQIAAWSADEVAWVDQNLKGFKGRVSRDNWVEQASTLAAGGTTEFASRVKKGDVYD
ncbi:MAG: NADH-quinone oxidoreductase subunit E, partial [Pseudomonadota bacterium]|nr:NADH-quinone oxidoreductase subunit E [Pseudomonadota bacterium]